jgi:hypothetical protein
MKELYKLIENDPRLKDRIKIIGIGAGNTPMEIRMFRDTYDTPFPLFADQDFSIHNVLGNLRTPYFLAVKIKESGAHEVVISEMGAFKGAQSFLESILSASGLQ